MQYRTSISWRRGYKVFLSWHLTHFAELRPGDHILTGTREGVGLGRNPTMFLKDGDVIELEVREVGRQRKLVRVPAAQH